MTDQILKDTIKMVDTKDEIIHNHAKKIAELTEKIEDLREVVEFWTFLADLRAEQIQNAIEFARQHTDNWNLLVSQLDNIEKQHFEKVKKGAHNATKV